MASKKLLFAFNTVVVIVVASETAHSASAPSLPSLRFGSRRAVLLRGGGGPKNSWGTPTVVLRGGEAKQAPPPPGQLSMSGSTFALVKNIIGAGMLALPAGVAAGRGTGFVPATLLVLASCLLSAYTFALVGRSCEATGAHDFRNLWTLTLGEGSAWMVDFMIMGVAAGALLVYGCFLGEILQNLSNGQLSRSFSILAISLCLAPLTLMPDLTALAPAAYVGVAAILYSMIFVVTRYVDGSCAEGGKFLAGLPFHPALEQISTGRLSVGTCVLFNMLSTAFMAHTNAVRFYNELENRTPLKFASMCNRAFIASAAVYIAVMLAGYMTFGASSQGLILNNYASQDLLAKIGRAATGVSIMGSHPLLFTSLRDVVVSTFRALKGSSALFASSTWSWRVLSIAMHAFITLTAILTNNVAFVVSVTGASFGAVLIFCVPSLIYLKILRDSKGSTAAPVNRNEVMFVHLLFLFGAFAAVFGTIVTCLLEFTNLLD